MSNETTQPTLTGISFHHVEASHISARVTDFGNFAIVSIHVGKADISLFASSLQEAHAIMGELGTYTTQPCKELQSS